MDEYSSSQSNSNGSSYALMSDMPAGGRMSELEDEMGKEESHRQLYSCRVCDAEFAEMRTLKIHTRTHTETELREAGVITSSSPEKSASPGLDSSGIDSPASPMSKSLQIESLKCDVCHEIFTTTAALARHSQGHNIEKPYRCDQCGATFSLPGTLTVHKRVHTNDRPYKCSSCGASFNQRSTFKTHLRVHTGERPYSCDLCDKSFSDVSTLKKHRRIHTGERPYECEMCGRAFTQAGNLQRHRRNHNLHPGGVQKCHVCSEFFEDLPSLKAHLKVHSSEMAVSCKPCNASLSYLCNLQKKHSSSSRKSESPPEVKIKWDSEGYGEHIVPRAKVLTKGTLSPGKDVTVELDSRKYPATVLAIIDESEESRETKAAVEKLKEENSLGDTESPLFDDPPAVENDPSLFDAHYPLPPTETVNTQDVTGLPVSSPIYETLRNVQPAFDLDTAILNECFPSGGGISTTSNYEVLLPGMSTFSAPLKNPDELLHLLQNGLEKPIKCEDSQHNNSVHNNYIDCNATLAADIKSEIC